MPREAEAQKVAREKSADAQLDEGKRRGCGRTVPPPRRSCRSGALRLPHPLRAAPAVPRYSRARALRPYLLKSSRPIRLSRWRSVGVGRRSEDGGRTWVPIRAAGGETFTGGAPPTPTMSGSSAAAVSSLVPAVASLRSTSRCRSARFTRLRPPTAAPRVTAAEAAASGRQTRAAPGGGSGLNAPRAARNPGGVVLKERADAARFQGAVSDVRTHPLRRRTVAGAHVLARPHANLSVCRRRAGRESLLTAQAWPGPDRRSTIRPSCR